jgi:hypothetical protein
LWLGAGPGRPGVNRDVPNCISQLGAVIAEVSSPPLSLRVSAARRYPGNSDKFVRKMLQQIIKRDYTGQRAVRPDDRKTPYTTIAHPLNRLVNIFFFIRDIQVCPHQIGNRNITGVNLFCDQLNDDVAMSDHSNRNFPSIAILDDNNVANMGVSHNLRCLESGGVLGALHYCSSTHFSNLHEPTSDTLASCIISLLST